MAKEETKKTTTKKPTPKASVAKKPATKKATSNKTTTVKKTATKKSPAQKSTKIIQEENNYQRLIIAGIIIAFVFIAGFLAIEYKKNGGFGGEKAYVATKDEKKFTEDYEKLNGTTNSSGTKYNDVKILADNNIIYITLDEAATMLDSGSGVIYFGYSSCATSREAVPVLLDAMTSSKLDKIYYVDIRPDAKKENDIRDEYTLNAKNKAKKTKDADTKYYEVLTSLANYLDDYILYTESGKKVNTGEKRLQTPTVVSLVNGEIVGFHEGTVGGHEESATGEISKLDKEQRKELLNTYSKIISKYLTSQE